MIDVFALCSSDTFLAGCQTPREKHYAFPGKRPWLRRIVPASEYVLAVTPAKGRENVKTPWHVLEEGHLRYIRRMISDATSLACGERVDEMNRKRLEFSSLFGSVKPMKPLAQSIGQATGIDGDRLYRETLRETPNSHLSVLLSTEMLFPGLTFPFLVVVREAYEEGLFPFGVFDGRLDSSYAGPDVLLCVNPADLEAKD